MSPTNPGRFTPADFADVVQPINIPINIGFPVKTGEPTESITGLPDDCGSRRADPNDVAFPSGLRIGRVTPRALGVQRMPLRSVVLLIGLRRRSLVIVTLTSADLLYLANRDARYVAHQ